MCTQVACLTILIAVDCVKLYTKMNKIDGLK